MFITYCYPGAGTADLSEGQKQVKGLPKGTNNMTKTLNHSYRFSLTSLPRNFAVSFHQIRPSIVFRGCSHTPALTPSRAPSTTCPSLRRYTANQTCKHHTCCRLGFLHLPIILYFFRYNYDFMMLLLWRKLSINFFWEKCSHVFYLKSYVWIWIGERLFPK